MSAPRLLILGYSQAAMLLRGTSGHEVTSLISIHGAREFGVEDNVRSRLDLSFDDAEVPAAGDTIALQRAYARKRWCEQNGLIEVAPTSADVSAIIQFAEQIRGTGGTLLCHCGGGMSRAPAAALICLAVWRGKATEAECVAEIHRLRPGAVPHQAMVRFADELLNRQGNLTGALTQFQVDAR